MRGNDILSFTVKTTRTKRVVLTLLKLCGGPCLIQPIKIDGKLIKATVGNG